jgi:excinuclease ABC subunit C
MSSNSDNAPRKGRDYVRDFVSRVTTSSGVYQMINLDGDVIYVGKAKNLKNRLSNYANYSGLTNRIMRMVDSICLINIIVTVSEAEALLLEANLIKKHQPRYNILLKDDKTYPYIRFSEHNYPRIVKHRGKQNPLEKYFGPFAYVGMVDETLTILQKAFLLRPCSDNIFKNRSRPCLQYQIKRCSAPCVNYVSSEEYADLLRQAELFLRGKSRDLQVQLAAQMQNASEQMQYEKAAILRDRIRILTSLQQQQRYRENNLGDADVIACYVEGGMACVQVWFFRGGQHFGNHAYFPSNVDDEDPAAILSLFIGQYYQTHPIPKRIFVNCAIKDNDVLQQALSILAKTKVELVQPKRGEAKQAVSELEIAAAEALTQRIAERRSWNKHLQAVQELFSLQHTPNRIEVFDNSHIAGTYAVGAMIVAGEEGFITSEYRRYNFRSNELKGGDDYAMMREMLTRRLQKIQTSEEAQSILLLIDGGKGQQTAVFEVMKKLNIYVPFVCIAKGEDRNAGREQFFVVGKEPFRLSHNDPTLHFLQRLRDEAHRFAITSHRIKRANAIKASSLDDIPKIGATRKRALMLHFGSAKAVGEATIVELQQVKGINAQIARQIYDYFHQ